MTIAVTLATLVGGLGLFFFGMELLATNLRRMTSQRFQRAVASATADPWKSLAAGCAFGAATQSLNAIAFITIGLVSAGYMTLAAALPLLIGANVGGRCSPTSPPSTSRRPCSPWSA